MRRIIVDVRCDSLEFSTMVEADSIAMSDDKSIIDYISTTIAISTTTTANISATTVLPLMVVCISNDQLMRLHLVSLSTSDGRQLWHTLDDDDEECNKRTIGSNIIINYGNDTSLSEEMKTTMSSNDESTQKHNNNNSTTSSDERDDGRPMFECFDALIDYYETNVDNNGWTKK